MQSELAMARPVLEIGSAQAVTLQLLEGHHMFKVQSSKFKVQS